MVPFDPLRHPESIKNILYWLAKKDVESVEMFMDFFFGMQAVL